MLPLLRETSNDLAQSYLQACLTFDSSKQHLLTRLLESASDMHTHPGEEGKDNAFMEGIAAALLGSDSALISRIPPAKSTSDAAKATQASINLLSMAARYQLSSLFVLTLQLLQLPVPDKLSAVDEELKRSLRQAIAPCRAALFSMMDASAALPYPFQLAQKQLDKLERVLDPVAYRRTTFLKPTTFPSIPLEMTYIIQSVMYDNCANAGNVLGGSIAARLAVNRAVSVATNRLSQQEVLSEWCADLFDSCFVHTNPVNASRSRGGARWRAFAFGRVPGLLRDLKEHAHLTSIDCDWTAAVDSGLEHFKERNKAKPAKDLSDWSKVMRDSFKSADERVSSHLTLSCLKV